MKERNRIATSNLERKRLKAGYGDWEANERDRAVSWRFSLPKQLCILNFTLIMRLLRIFESVFVIFVHEEAASCLRLKFPMRAVYAANIVSFFF